MAVVTGCGGVFTVQWEDGLVGETFQPVHPVVAGQTVQTILGQVFLHEGLVMVVVTGYAALGGGMAGVSRMAGGAVNGVTSIIHGMQV